MPELSKMERGVKVVGAYYEVKLTLNKILKKLEALDSEISGIARDVGVPRGVVKTVFISTSLNLTRETLKELGGRRTASEIAAITGRARAVESMHLNELVRNDMATKERRGRVCVFILREEYHAEG